MPNRFVYFNLMSPIKVLLVEDHEVVREGLKTVLNGYDGIEIVGEAGTAAEAVDQASKLKPDLVLLDLRLPDASGFHACRRIQRLAGHIRVLILTSVADDDTVVESISAGADGYLLKTIDSDELASSIRKVMEGKSVLDPTVTRAVFAKVKNSSESEAEDNKLSILSKQEYRIMALVAEGKTNKEIAASMNLSDKTVKNYLSNAMDKLNMTRRTQAAVFFTQNVND